MVTNITRKVKYGTKLLDVESVEDIHSKKGKMSAWALQTKRLTAKDKAFLLMSRAHTVED